MAAEPGMTAHKLTPVAESTPFPVATDVRVGGDDKQTRFVVDLSQKIDVATFTLADPYRVVIDLPQVTFKLPAQAGEHGRGLVKAFRFGLIMQGGSRIVLDTKGPVRVDKAFTLAAVDDQPARLVHRSHRDRPRELPARHDDAEPQPAHRQQDQCQPAAGGRHRRRGR